MLLEKVEKQVKKNKFVGRWTEPVYHWIKDFRSRSEALDFAKKHGIEDVRFWWEQLFPQCDKLHDRVRNLRRNLDLTLNFYYEFNFIL